MVADSRFIWSGVISQCPDKVRRTRDASCLVGIVGDAALAVAFAEWFEDEANEVPFDALATENKIDALVLKDDGLYWTDGRSVGLNTVHEPAWAIGSGAPFALGALWAG